MSLFGGQQPAAPVPPPAVEQNGLGIAGFVCSLLGLLVTGGLLCPIGLIMSLVALGRRPRGFAIAGTIIGAVGSCGILAALLGIVLFGAAAVAALFGVTMLALSEPQKLEITSDMVQIAIAIETYEDRNGYLPAELSVLDLKPTLLVDPWGNDYQYHLTDERTFDLVSAGVDGTFGTMDDISIHTLDETWEDASFEIDLSQRSDDGNAEDDEGEAEDGGA